jgi:hypothetical protein
VSASRRRRFTSHESKPAVPAGGATPFSGVPSERRSVRMKHADRVLAALADREMSGHELRTALNAGKHWWQRWSVQGFYALMDRLEDTGLIEGWWHEDTGASGTIFTERRYRRVWRRE